MSTSIELTRRAEKLQIITHEADTSISIATHEASQLSHAVEVIIEAKAIHERAQGELTQDLYTLGRESGAEDNAQQWLNWILKEGTPNEQATRIGGLLNVCQDTLAWAFNFNPELFGQCMVQAQIYRVAIAKLCKEHSLEHIGAGFYCKKGISPEKDED